MEQKTRIHAEYGEQQLTITRTFDLPLELLFKAHSEPELIEQWMGTKVIVLENKNQGAWQYETTDPKGNKHVFYGVIHEFVPEQTIIRTFQMANTPFPVQLEFLEFSKLADTISKLEIQMVYKSVADRDAMLKLPFAMGINMAHNRIEALLKK